MAAATNQNPGCLTRVLHLFGIDLQANQAVPTVGATQQDQQSAPSVAPVGENQQATPVTELLRQDQQAATNVETFPYKVNFSLLVKSELPFYHILSSVVGERRTICPKVRLGDVFFVIDFKENLPQYFNIASKHIDFLLCEPRTMKPIVGIELDDIGHNKQDRKERDVFIRKVFEAAGLSLIHIPVQPKYDPDMLSKRLAPYLGDAPGQSNAPNKSS